ncbi:MAG: phenylacetate-CoA oxygenase subunit PaaJ [Chloroflexi bacterium]|nr:phenylacetate-CoA oxygenase subunit PaaJ [Chloroflexota bacterium]
MQTQVVTEQEIWDALDEVVDPEIPVVSLVEMGIIRAVILDGARVVVTMTPTFSGCPALEVMEGDIKARLAQMGLEDVRVEKALDPPWSSDWISDAARAKLKGIGLAPPRVHGGDFIAVLDAPVTCPYCDSFNTSIKNSFGPTPCRMIFYCNNCQQPFELFKPL